MSGEAMNQLIQSLFSGLILKTMRHKDRQDFELRLIEIDSEKRDRLN